MGRAPCCSKVGLMRGPWSAKEDALLTDYIQQHGEGQWCSLPKKAGLLRCGKSCRLRWMNYLRPGIKRGNISEDEEDLIVRLHGLLGNRWSLIAGRLPGRTDNEIKNYWNTYLLKKLQNSGIVNPNPRQHHSTKKKSNDNNNNSSIKSKDDDSQSPKKRRKVANKNKKSLSKDEDVIKVNNTEGRRDKAGSVFNKVKVYLPKPTRVCSVLPRTESLDSLASGAVSRGTTKPAGDTVVPEMKWKPAVFELGEAAGYCDGVCGVDDNDLLRPLFASGSMSSDDVDMFHMVFDDYLQLL